MNKNYINNGYNLMNHYVVKSGDSLYMIAKAYNTSVDKLKEINHLYSNTIYPNQILYIPTNNMIDNYQTNDCPKNTYLTTDGESLKDILNKFNLNFDDLQNYNDLHKLKLEGNQMLLIDKRKSYKVHKVEYGETIEDILAKYQLSPLEFLKLNEKEILEPGEEIIVER